LAAHNITTLQLAKVDIEGAEREVFAAPSAAVWLNRTREVWIEAVPTAGGFCQFPFSIFPSQTS